MRGIRLILIVALAIAGLALGTSVGASTAKGSGAAKGAGLQVRDLVLNGGVHAYVRVPDRVERLLSNADVPAFSCPGAATKVNNSAVQTCTWAPTYAGSVTCIQVSISANVTQTCEATQANTTTNNNALIAQVIWSKNPSVDQDGTQIVRLRQTNVSGANNAGVGQFIKQSKGPGTPDDTEESDAEPLATPTVSANQNQEGHQTIHLHQVTSGLTAGDDNAALLQFLRQRERIANAATTNQNQNVQSRSTSCMPELTSDALVGVSVDPNANQCILSNQTSSNGKLNLLMNGDYNQLQRTRKATTGSQTQGVPFQGGSDYGLTQDSTGLAKILTNQNERQVQRAIDSNVFQNQNGPRKGSGSTQGTNPQDTWLGSQSSTQIQTNTTTGLSLQAVSPGNQTNIFEYFGNTSGDIRATQTANQNGDVTTNSCPPPNAPSTTQNQVCAATIVCTTPDTGFLSVEQTSNCTATTVCPEGSHFDPETGTCVPDCGVDCIPIILGATTPTPLYSRRR
jgi:hypothetical protein